MRRLPKQARSKARVTAIVAATIDQLRTVGYDNLSTASVAKQAGVAVGTLYQFFDNKDDLMQAVAEQHIAAMQQFRDINFGADAVYVPPEILVNRTLDWLVAHNAQSPTFHQIFGGSWESDGLNQMMDAVMGGIVSDLAVVVRHHAPHLPDDAVQVGAGVLVYVIKGMFAYLESADLTDHPAIIAGYKRMLLVSFNDLVGLKPT